jgi:hypothetical protein
MIVDVDDCPCNFCIVEHVVEGKSFAVSSADDDDIPHSEDSAHSFHHDEYCLVLRSGLVGDSKQVLDNGSDFFRDLVPDNLADQLPRYS